MSPLDKRLLLVTGKGGVGKTTVAAALGLAATRRGKRVILCELGEQERLAALFGSPLSDDAERELAPGLFGVTVDPERTKEEWLRYQLKSDTLAGLLGSSRVFQYLTAAAPGLTELVSMGKVWDLAQLERRTEGAVYDLAIVDAPATGHGLAMLSAPSTYAGVARVGPISRQADIIDAFVRDPDTTGVLAVTLPEEIPVNETIELEERLRDELEMALDAVVVNAVHPQRFTAAEARRLEGIDGRGSDEARAAIRSALSEERLARAERSQARRLKRASAAKQLTLPFVVEPELRLEELGRLARVLERKL